MSHAGFNDREAESSSNGKANEAPRRGLRWWPAAVLVGLSVFGQIGANSFVEDRTFLIMVTMGLQAFVLLALTVWWWAFSRASWRTKIVGEVGAIAAIGIFLYVFRIDGFRADMVPILRPVWAKSKEQRSAEFWQKSARPARKAAEKPAEGAAAAEKAPPIASATDSPEYRGVGRDGIARHPPLDPQKFSSSKLLWKHPVGLGWSSFAVVGKRAWTQEQRLENEAVVCYDLDTGEELWSHLDPVRFSEAMGGDGPRATPTWHEGRVYAVGATGLINCLDAETGAVVWARDMFRDTDAKNIEWGMAGSPLIYDRFVIACPGGAQGNTIAYDRLTGAPAWKSGNGPASYASPQRATLLGVPQILVFEGLGLRGRRPSDGKELWFVNWTNPPKCNAMQPIVLGENRLLISSGYGSGAAFVDLNRQGETWSAQLGQKIPKLRMKISPAVVYDGHVYAFDENLLTCVRLDDGKTTWKQRGYGYGQLLLVGDQLLVQSELGPVVLLAAAPDSPRELAVLEVFEGKTWNIPVLCNNRLLVRNAEEAACFAVVPREAAE